MDAGFLVGILVGTGTGIYLMYRFMKWIIGGIKTKPIEEEGWDR